MVFNWCIVFDVYLGVELLIDDWGEVCDYVVVMCWLFWEWLLVVLLEWGVDVRGCVWVVV